MADHQGILAGARERWKASLLFKAADFTAKFRELMTSSIFFVELIAWISSGLIKLTKELQGMKQRVECYRIVGKEDGLLS